MLPGAGLHDEAQGYEEGVGAPLLQAGPAPALQFQQVTLEFPGGYLQQDLSLLERPTDRRRVVPLGELPTGRPSGGSSAVDGLEAQALSGS